MRKVISSIILFLSLLVATDASADYYVVVNANNPQSGLTKAEALNLFMGRSRAFANGDFALVFDLPRDNPKREGFYRTLTGLSLVQITSYWARLMFSGQSLPPQPLPDESTMVEIIKHNPNAVGWLSSPPTDKGLHALLVLKEQP